VELVKRCRLDIPKYCRPELEAAAGKDATELEGKVIGCLRIKFAQRGVRPDCVYRSPNILPLSKGIFFNFEVCYSLFVKHVQVYLSYKLHVCVCVCVFVCVEIVTIV
jgi:hypothetical protein